MFLAMVNAKGGVGKSTLAVHLAVWLDERGQRVMLVDCDLQRSSSQWMAEAAPEVRVEVLLSEDELIERAPVFQQEVDIVVADGPAGLKELTRALLLVCDTAFAQFIAVCRRSKFGYTRTSRLRRGSPLCTRLALKRRGDTQRLSQVLRATKCDKLSDLLKGLWNIGRSGG